MVWLFGVAVNVGIDFSSSFRICENYGHMNPFYHRLQACFMRLWASPVTGPAARASRTGGGYTDESRFPSPHSPAPGR